MVAYIADDRDTRGRGLTINPPDECMRKKIAMKLDSHLIVKCEVVGDTVEKWRSFLGGITVREITISQEGLETS